MARHDRIRKLKTATDRQPDRELREHMVALGLKSTDDYVAWCADHGFSRRLKKHWRQRLKERSYFDQAVAQARLGQKKKELRNRDKTIDAIFRGELEAKDVSQPHLKEICWSYRVAKNCRRTRLALFELLLHAAATSDLLDARPVVAEYGRQPSNTFIGGLLAVARFSRSWRRPLNEWKPQTHNARRQFSSLVRYLFAEWPVPAFMDSVWFKGDAEAAARQQAWFLHVGSGQNIRTADLPIAFTKRMAHHFLQAPCTFTIESALRWGQIHGLGGDARLAAAIAATRLADEFANDDFWATVLRFFIANPMLDTAHIGPIVDFIYHQRFVLQQVFARPGVAEQRAPAQPNFTMKGRNVESLLRQVEAWHESLSKNHQALAEWPKSGIACFELIEGSERNATLKVWTISELLNSKALAAEGRTMKHCVASYARSCASGRTSIWTLEVETFEGRSKLLTIEVQNAARLICQARGKCNAMPAEKQRGVLRRWAEKAGLTLARYV